jgi:hypothetical protein
MVEIVRRVDAERLAELWMFPRCEPPSRHLYSFILRAVGTQHLQ